MTGQRSRVTSITPTSNHAAPLIRKVKPRPQSQLVQRNKAATGNQLKCGQAACCSDLLTLGRKIFGRGLERIGGAERAEVSSRGNAKTAKQNIALNLVDRGYEMR